MSTFPMDGDVFTTATDKLVADVRTYFADKIRQDLYSNKGAIDETIEYPQIRTFQEIWEYIRMFKSLNTYTIIKYLDNKSVKFIGVVGTYQLYHQLFTFDGNRVGYMNHDIVETLYKWYVVTEKGQFVLIFTSLLPNNHGHN